MWGFPKAGMLGGPGVLSEVVPASPVSTEQSAWPIETSQSTREQWALLQSCSPHLTTSDSLQSTVGRSCWENPEQSSPVDLLDWLSPTYICRVRQTLTDNEISPARRCDPGSGDQQWDRDKPLLPPGTDIHSGGREPDRGEAHTSHFTLLYFTV